jgi:hypothetical protein
MILFLGSIMRAGGFLLDLACKNTGMRMICKDKIIARYASIFIEIKKRAVND